jgi:hypothetical protein
MIYVLASKSLIIVPPISQFAVQFDADAQSVAYFLGAMSLSSPVLDAADLQTTGELDGLDFSSDLIKLLIDQFKSGTAASRHFSSIVLERIAHSPEGVDCIMGENLDRIGLYVTQNRPKDAEDARPIARSAVFLSAVFLNVWRRAAATNSAAHCALFAATVTPLAAVIATQTEEGEACYARIAQAMFLEVLGLMATFDDLLLALHNEEMMSTVVGLAVGQDVVGKEARTALFNLSRVDPFRGVSPAGGGYPG